MRYQTLLENRQQYRQMLQKMVKQNIITSQEADAIANDVRKSLGRNDRIVWWLKWYRIFKTEEHVSDISANFSSAEELVKWFQSITGYRLSNLAEIRRMRTTFNRYFDLQSAEFDHLIDSIDRYTSINDLVWDPEIDPNRLIDTIRSLEREEINKKKQWVKPKEIDQVILTYNNGQQAWVNLNRAYCDAEGGAMGHCGNTASYRPDDRILSFRTIKDDQHKPHLTFILDGDGMLGEMKGRANRKPDPKYHPYIVDLLKQDFVKGIKGGGYAPEQNFQLSDLDENTRKNLTKLKPELIDFFESYRIEGMTARTERLFFEKLNQLGLPDIHGFDGNTVILERFSNAEDFFQELGYSNFELPLEVMNRIEDINDFKTEDLRKSYRRDELEEIVDSLNLDYSTTAEILSTVDTSVLQTVADKLELNKNIENYRDIMNLSQIIIDDNTEYYDSIRKAIAFTQTPINKNMDQYGFQELMDFSIDAVERSSYNLMYYDITYDGPSDPVQLTCRLDDFVDIMQSDEDDEFYSMKFAAIENQTYFDVDYYNLKDYLDDLTKDQNNYRGVEQGIIEIYKKFLRFLNSPLVTYDTSKINTREVGQEFEKLIINNESTNLNRLKTLAGLT